MPKKQSSANATGSSSDSSGSMSASQIYQKMEHKEHIYKKPDTYTGSCEEEDYSTFVAYPCSASDGDSEDTSSVSSSSTTSSFGETIRVAFETIRLTPAFYKCFDELLVNAYDHKKRMDKVRETLPNDDSPKQYPVTQIRVSIHDDGSISFMNDGNGILVEYMEEHKMYPPELIFGTLLTSTNYDDSQEREWGGRNGYGAKLANIFSKRFHIETVCHIHKKKYIQEFTDNMNQKTEPKITSCSTKPYTKITWLPDYERFSMKNGMSESVKALIYRRVIDIAGITDKTTKVYYNDQLIPLRGFDHYVKLYLPKGQSYVYDNCLGWDIIATVSSDDVFEQVSFVNGIHTLRGGTHVESVADQLKAGLVELLKKKKKLDVKPQLIKNQLRLFVNATKIINPVFDSQTKETLKTPKSKFGTGYEVSDKFLKALYDTEIIDKIQSQLQQKDMSLLAKTDGAMKKKVRIDKLCDANKAGTVESQKCTIIFTEGDSAKSLAIGGLSEVGRDYYGVYPLRGKVLNVRDEDADKVAKCAVINDIKQILGLQTGRDYYKEFVETGRWSLRYGRILLMTDQDLDGSHIKGLVMNIFDSMWKNLLQMGFITSMVTPIIKATKGNHPPEVFYTLQDYEKWKEAVGTTKGWTIKYYKGLGTSTKNEAKEYFQKLKVIEYVPTMNPTSQELSDDTDSSSSSKDLLVDDPLVPNEDTMSTSSTTSTSSTSSRCIQPLHITVKIKTPKKNDNRLDLAFNKARADDRKEWLKYYNRQKYPDFNQPKLTFTQFVDEELIHFSNASNDRAIPNMMDGLKPSQRKILYCAFKRNLTSEVKVAQFAGYVSEHSAYHHGEASLEQTIRSMAQDFVGSNNVNLFMPCGQFGTRLEGGDDAAQSRYIFTHLHPITRTLFRKEDEPLLQYLDDDGFKIEPAYYYPVLPTVLMNGSVGMGTGFSTDIPMYHPLDIADAILHRLLPTEYPTKPLAVWYRGFRGSVIAMDDKPGSYFTRGIYEIVGQNVVHITELPIDKWTNTYIEFLNHSMNEAKKDDKNNKKDNSKKPAKTDAKKDESKYFVKDYEDNSTDTHVNIRVKMDPDLIQKWSQKKDRYGISELEKKLKLYTSHTTTNMHMFDQYGKMRLFATVDDMMDEWFPIRLDGYVKRRLYMLEQMKRELNIVEQKVRFIEAIVEERIEIRNVKKSVLLENLATLGFMKLTLKPDGEPSYDYLLSMDLYKLTVEEIDRLRTQYEGIIAEYDTLEKTTASDLWKADIESFKRDYKTHLSEFEREYWKDTQRNTKGKSGKTAAKRSGK